MSIKHGEEVSILRAKDVFSYPCITSLTMCNGKYYGNRFDRNGLLGLDLEKGTVHVEKIYGSVDALAEWQFGALITVKDVLYSIPLFADYIAVYSIEKRSIGKIVLDDSKLLASKAKLDAAFLVDDDIWMTPKSCFCMAKLDVLTNNISYYDGMETILRGECYEKWPHIVRKTICSLGKIYMMLWESNCLIEFDIVNKRYQKLNCFDGGVTIRDIVTVGKIIVIYCSNGKVYCLQDGELNSICQLENSGNPKSMLAVDYDVWIVDSCSNSIVVIKPESNGYDSIKTIYIDHDIHNGFLWFDGSSKVYILPSKECRQTVIIDINDFSTQKKMFKISAEDEMLYRELIKKRSMFYEKKVTLDDFLGIKFGCC